MPAELAMLHENAPAPEALLEAFHQVCPQGTVLELRDGQVTVLLDELGGHVMTIFPPVWFDVETSVLASELAVVGDVAPSARYWTDVTIPLGDDGSRERAAQRVAELTNGWLHVRAGGIADV